MVMTWMCHDSIESVDCVLKGKMLEFLFCEPKLQVNKSLRVVKFHVNIAETKWLCCLPCTDLLYSVCTCLHIL